MTFRNICWTVNNYDDIMESNCSQLYDNVGYTIFAREVGSNGTPHLQGYTELKKPMRLNAIKNMFRVPTMHIENRKGTQTQARDYCIKDQLNRDTWDVVQIGQLKGQGKRTDLELMKERIEEGETVDNLTIENPMLFHKYGRTLTKVEDIYMRKKFRTWMTTCEWLWGKTGVGKSHRAFENYDPEKCYLWNPDNGWWDGYCGQETVIINEFRGQIQFSELLTLIDKWPHSVRRRGREPMPFLARHVIITSCGKPEEIYSGISESDRIDQLLRRVSVTEVVRG